MKRTNYTIPLSIFTLSLSACGDPIVAEYNVTTANNVPLPYVAPGLFTISASMTVDEDLNAVLTAVIDYEDDVAYTDYTNVYSGPTTVIEKGAKYTIALVGDGGDTLDLDCDMNAEFNLACTDVEGAVFAFEVIQ